MTELSSSSIKARKKDIVTMICAVQGEPPITFSWKKNKSLSSLVELQEPYPGSILLVTLEDKESFGKYICDVHDRFSQRDHSITVEDLSTGYNFFVSVFLILPRDRMFTTLRPKGNDFSLKCCRKYSSHWTKDWRSNRYVQLRAVLRVTSY